MQKIRLLILLSGVCVLLFGCGTLKEKYGGSKQDTKKQNMSKEQMRKELETLRSENQQLKLENNLLLNENKKISEIKEQLTTLREENERLGNEKKSLETKIAWKNVEKEELEKKLSVSKGDGDTGNLKIKVLAGDGDLVSAQNMANRLNQMGYRIKIIDRAPRATFVQNTVYYTQASKEAAEALAARLGDEAVLKPLTWPSVFDIIVVTGGAG